MALVERVKQTVDTDLIGWILLAAAGYVAGQRFGFEVIPFL